MWGEGGKDLLSRMAKVEEFVDFNGGARKSQNRNDNHANGRGDHRKKNRVDTSPMLSDIETSNTKSSKRGDKWKKEMTFKKEKKKEMECLILCNEEDFFKEGIREG